MPEDETTQEPSTDDIQDLLQQAGAAPSPRLLRLRRIAASMQSLEWQLARKNANREAAPDENR